MNAVRRTLGGIGRLLSVHALRIFGVALIFLILYGAAPGTSLAWALLLFVAARSVMLLFEALRRHLSADDWELRRADLERYYAQLAPDDREREALRLGIESRPTASALAQAALAVMRKDTTAPRARAELACEALGLLAFGLLIPVDVLLLSRDFVSPRQSQGLLGFGVALLCVTLYAWPHTWSQGVRTRARRMLWWGMPFVPALVLLHASLQLRHPYLDPFREDRARLAAERVLALEDNIVGERHADWIFDYAASIEDDDPERAAQLYRGGLRLSPTNEAAHARLAFLEFASGKTSSAALRSDASAHARARAPLWGEREVAARLPRCTVDAGLEAVERTTVVLVPVGDVPDAMLDIVGAVIQRELSLPSCLAGSVPLPPHTRVRGLVTGRQWGHRSLVQAFVQQVGAFPRAPVKFVLLTPVDIYLDDSTNFAFSGTFEWGALVSYARFSEGAPPGSPVLVNRAAKQVLGALTKSFGVPMSSDPDCVTSYSNGMPQFEAKGNRPNAESLAILGQVLRGYDRAWAAHERGDPAPVP